MEKIEELPEDKAVGFYMVVLKLSCKMYNQIEKLKEDNPMLNRPFIYNKNNLQTTLIKDQLNIRDILI